MHHKGRYDTYSGAVGDWWQTKAAQLALETCEQVANLQPVMQRSHSEIKRGSGNQQEISSRGNDGNAHGKLGQTGPVGATESVPTNGVDAVRDRRPHRKTDLYEPIVRTMD